MIIDKDKPLTAYKAFNEKLQCNNFQFEIGKSYEHSGKVSACNSGFHSCLNPFDCLSYYNLIDVRFCEVEIWGELSVEDDSKDSKQCTQHILIKREISAKEFHKLCVDFTIKESVRYSAQNASSGDSAQNASSGDSAKNASSGDYAQNASSGYYAKNASSGDSAKNASSGYSAQNASSGYYAKNASSGDYAQNASSGYSAQNASSGDSAKNASSGDYAQNASSGDYAQNASSGYSAKNASSGYYAKNASSGYSAKNASSGDYASSVVTGKNSVDASIGKNSKTKGVVGTWITLAEYDDKNICIVVKSARIDGKKLKADTFYTLKNKKFTEVQ